MPKQTINGPKGALDKVPIGSEQRSYHDLRYELNKGTTSSLLVRKEGAIIRRLQVNGVDILATGTSLDSDAIEQPLKIDATHTMLPAGPNDVGPQHGPSRYLDYEIEHSTEGLVSLRAREPLRNLGHMKKFELQPDGLEITDTVENLGPVNIGLSIGEHLYFSVAEENLANIRFVKEDGNDTVITGHRDDGSYFTGNYSQALADFSGGRTIFDESFTGTQLIEIPRIGRIRLSAQAMKEGSSLPAMLFMWHRPGADTVCFEPVSGITVSEDGLRNDGIALGSGENLELHTKIQLIND